MFVKKVVCGTYDFLSPFVYYIFQKLVDFKENIIVQMKHGYLIYFCCEFDDSATHLDWEN